MGLASTTLAAEEAAFLRRVQPSGIILFSRNIQEFDQLHALITTVREQISPPCTIWVDQEGGRVQRLRAPFTCFPSPWHLAHWQGTPATISGFPIEKRAFMLARVAGDLCGMELAAMGIGVNCGPVLDIREVGADPVIGDRAFGDTPQRVIQLAGAWLSGLQQRGIMAVGKHFPGHGAALQDSHVALPIINKGRAALENWELQPFQQLMARLPAIMTAHLVASALGDHEPATFSMTLLRGMLRSKWGYQGLLVSDALEMGALTGPLEVRARRAMLAGCDVVLCCSGKLEDSAATLDGIQHALEIMPVGRWARCEKRVRQGLAPYGFPPGDWRALLQQPDYQRARRLVESVTEAVQAHDPTEFMPVGGMVPSYAG